jgi:hypothetical protein
LEIPQVLESRLQSATKISQVFRSIWAISWEQMEHLSAER